MSLSEADLTKLIVTANNNLKESKFELLQDFKHASATVKNIIDRLKESGFGDLFEFCFFYTDLQTSQKLIIPESMYSIVTSYNRHYPGIETRVKSIKSDEIKISLLDLLETFKQVYQQFQRPSPRVNLGLFRLQALTCRQSTQQIKSPATSATLM